MEHADEMARLLDDPALHRFIGGEPASAVALHERYTRQVVGHSPDGSQRWLNWVVRRRDAGQAVGTTQATVTASVTEQGETVTAEVAWVIGTAAQGQGYATEAARTMTAWLRTQGVHQVVAHVHPDHRASQAVARAAGLTATTTVLDGEVRWQG